MTPTLQGPIPRSRRAGRARVGRRLEPFEVDPPRRAREGRRPARGEPAAGERGGREPGERLARRRVLADARITARSISRARLDWIELAADRAQRRVRDGRLPSRPEAAERRGPTARAAGRARSGGGTRCVVVEREHEARLVDRALARGVHDTVPSCAWHASAHRPVGQPRPPGPIRVGEPKRVRTRRTERRLDHAPA